MQRYSEITQKQTREIVLLKGKPCAWGQCSFCDYIDDNETDESLCNAVNQEVLAQVTGKYHALEVINSGSIFELPQDSLDTIKRILREKDIRTLFAVTHWS